MVHKPSLSLYPFLLQNKPLMLILVHLLASLFPGWLSNSDLSTNGHSLSCILGHFLVVAINFHHFCGWSVPPSPLIPIPFKGAMGGDTINLFTLPQNWLVVKYHCFDNHILSHPSFFPLTPAPLALIIFYSQQSVPPPLLPTIPKISEEGNHTDLFGVHFSQPIVKLWPFLSIHHHRVIFCLFPAINSLSGWLFAMTLHLPTAAAHTNLFSIARA